MTKSNWSVSRPHLAASLDYSKRFRRLQLQSCLTSKENLSFRSLQMQILTKLTCIQARFKLPQTMFYMMMNLTPSRIILQEKPLLITKSTRTIRINSWRQFSKRLSSRRFPCNQKLLQILKYHKELKWIRLTLNRWNQTKISASLTMSTSKVHSSKM